MSPLMGSTPSVGSRVFSVVLAVVVGVVFATIGTVIHQATIGDFPLPLILAIIGVIAILVGFRLLLDDRLVVLAGGIGIVLTIVLFSFVGPGGTLLIPQNLVGLIWTIVPVLVVTVAVSWPRIPAVPKPMPVAEAPGAASASEAERTSLEA